jgi:hypothetical protein
MGLLYVMPIELKETDRVEKLEDGIVLKSYGLPLLFWGYLAGIIVIISAMGLAIKDPLITLYQTGDQLNQLLALACGTTLLAVPLGFISLFLYEYRLIVRPERIIKQHTILGLPFYWQTLPLTNKTQLEVIHFMDSPNVAKLAESEDLRGFQNKGHFLLVHTNEQGKRTTLDRSSRKVDLTKLKQLLLVHNA